MYKQLPQTIKQNGNEHCEECISKRCIEASFDLYSELSKVEEDRACGNLGYIAKEVVKMTTMAIYARK